jgi:hypothetical protein
MDNITPSPAADGPFTLIEHTLSDNITKEIRPIHKIDPHIVALSNRGKTLSEIGQILHDEALAAHSARPSPNV